MHIVYIAQYFNLPSEPGGSRVYQFAKRWVVQGHRVTLITGFLNHKTMKVPERFRGRLWARESIEGIDVLRVYSYPRIQGSFLRRSVNFLSFAFFASLYGLIRVEKADLVYATSTPLTVGVPGLVLRFGKRVPLVFEVRDLWPESAVVAGVLRRGWLVRGVEWFARRIYRASTLVVALTRGIADGLAKAGVPRDKIRFAPNGIDDWMVSDGVTAAPRENLGLEEKFVCIYTGAHGMWNRLETILETADLLRDENQFAFLLVGDGDAKPQLLQWARDRRLANVTFLEPMPKREAMSHVKMADCCLITTWDHPFQRMIFPNKIFDYMGCGRPTVAAADGESADLIREAEAGMAVPPEKPAELAAALRQLAALPRAERDRMGQRAREHALAHFRREEIAQTLLDEFHRLG